jgi:hypothetical protein
LGAAGHSGWADNCHQPLCYPSAKQFFQLSWHCFYEEGKQQHSSEMDRMFC